ncbi:Exonuclease [Corchorus olitorius]|uniref:Exonuclease n=1 Tax=Corchorus olitorius TaxID=93759 RepID=A0A1R3HGT5_9ROSI|nr:Exonuclease [Corchorus olitorius]
MLEEMIVSFDLSKKESVQREFLVKIRIRKRDKHQELMSWLRMCHPGNREMGALSRQALSPIWRTKVEPFCCFIISFILSPLMSIAKQECKSVFNIRGCRFCLAILDSPYALRIHQDRCQLSGGILAHLANIGLRDSLKIDNGYSRGPQVVALACKMVGGGSDSSLDLCARVCLIDENENIIFHTYVKPQIPVTNYRYESTGIRPEYLRDAMPLRQVQKRIQDFLCNGEPIWKIRSPRDTAKYPPLMKTSKLSNSLKYLTQAYLGYDIQSGIQDPYEDCVATIRLYLRMRKKYHRREDYPLASDPQNRNNFASWRQNELERMSPEEMLAISRSDYYCWCLDSA